LKENTTLQNKVEQLQNDYETICSQLRQKEMQLEDLKANLSEIVSIISIFNLFITLFKILYLYRKINMWMPIKMKKKQTIYVLILMY
jgi:hypothetical protein